MKIRPITPADAAAIASWRYPAPYDVYDGDDEPDYLLDPANGFVALDHDGELAGFRSFGPDGRFPGGPYDDAAIHPGGLDGVLDTGGGLRPDLTGRGLGGAAIAAGLAYGETVHSPRLWRITVAAFNTRALTVVGRLGFAAVAEFSSPRGADFVILVRAAAG
ncbi:N-acetyltransferase [Actinorhabdospora filicis]|uniref:N-acetyltransferase n=1 Tax=Actinorhabdospora filicis TaxID=1785913 RepID=A0A9W6WB87_9ACTN|nr:GNAT family N-acetyltransferase [Actinorhabdospora filicis]GLZ79838.1 N-acetyltransferase [Actinorhabdospora filicis]